MILSEIANYVDESIRSTDITLEEYITIDCLLQNKEGRTIATNLPPSPCRLTKYKPGDILIGNIRPYLKKIWKANCEGGCSNDVLVFRAKDSKLSDYLYALLLQDNFYSYVMKAPKGSKMPRGDKNHIMRFPVADIGSNGINVGEFISDIERKMTNNRKQNDLLEKMAKQIYDYWFVQFDFPDENGKPYKSSGGAMVYNEQLKREIPKGWECKKLEKILDVISRRTTIESAKSLNYAPIEVIPRNKMSFHECAPIEKAVSGLCEFEKKHILLSNRRVYFHKVCIAPFDGITRDTVIVFQPKIINSLAYSFQIVNSDSFIGYATQQSYGSEQPVLSWTAAKEYKVAFPSQHLIDKYCEKMNDFIELVLDNENEQNYLKKLRNVILPLLMTGQATLK